MNEHAEYILDKSVSQPESLHADNAEYWAKIASSALMEVEKLKGAIAGNAAEYDRIMSEMIAEKYILRDEHEDTQRDLDEAQKLILTLSAVARKSAEGVGHMDCTLAEARHELRDAYSDRDKAIENLEKVSSKYDAAIIRAQDAERDVELWRKDSQQWAQRAMEAEWIIATEKKLPNIPFRRALGLLLVSLKYATLRLLRKLKEGKHNEV